MPRWKTTCIVCHTKFYKTVPGDRYEFICQACSSEIGTCKMCGIDMPRYSRKDGSIRKTCSQTCHNRMISTFPEYSEMREKRTRQAFETIFQNEGRMNELREMGKTLHQYRKNLCTCKVCGGKFKNWYEKYTAAICQECYEQFKIPCSICGTLTEMFDIHGKSRGYCSKLCRKQGHSISMRLKYKTDSSLRERNKCHLDMVREKSTMPEKLKIRSDKMKRIWEDPQYRQNQSKMTTGLHRAEEYKRKRALGYIPWYKNVKRTSIEVAVGDELKRLGIVAEFNQHVGYYFVDWAIINLKIAVECDGRYWHSFPDSIARDARKDAYLTKNGWTVVRLSEDDINKDVVGVVAKRLLPLLQKLKS